MAQRDGEAVSRISQRKGISVSRRRRNREMGRWRNARDVRRREAMALEERWQRSMMMMS